MGEHQLLIGACGWEHADWQDQFYPDDLPEDWRLGYYSNNYRVVLLPAELTRRTDLDIEVLLEDSASSLRFVVELCCSDFEDSPALKRQLDRLDAFGNRCAGIICRLDESDAIAATEVQLRLEQCAVYFPVSVQLPREIEGDSDDWSHLHGVGVVWDGHGAPSTHSALNVARITETAMSPKALRQIVETCLAWGEAGETTVLLFDGQPPTLELIDNAGVILDLL